MATTYKVQIKCEGTFETNYTTTNKKQAVQRSKDLAAAGYDGRIVTAKGHVSQTWELVK
jgi:hypothetical protein